MILTKKYIMNHRTQRGSWTRSQLKAIGVNWPPARGWQKRAIGREISQEAAKLFETKITAKQEKRASPRMM